MAAGKATAQDRDDLVEEDAAARGQDDAVAAIDDQSVSGEIRGAQVDELEECPHRTDDLVGQNGPDQALEAGDADDPQALDRGRRAGDRSGFIDRAAARPTAARAQLDQHVKRAAVPRAPERVFEQPDSGDRVDIAQEVERRIAAQLASQPADRGRVDELVREDHALDAGRPRQDDLGRRCDA